jgi:TPR repeat protein
MLKKLFKLVLVAIIGLMATPPLVAQKTPLQRSQAMAADGLKAYRAGKIDDAYDLFDEACKIGSGEGCYYHAYMHDRGESTPVNKDYARDQYKFACSYDYMPACYNYGRMLAVGEGGAADPKEARTVLQKVCDAGTPQGCNTLGFLLDEGKGGPKDQVKARALYQKACDGKVAGACTNLGIMLFTGAGGSRDEAKGLSMLQSTCKGGDEFACKRIATLQGKPAPGATAVASAPIDAQSLQAGIAAYNAKRYPEAARLLPGHARAGNRDAQYIMGFLHASGVLGQRNYLLAADYLTGAAEQGDTDAQDLLVTIAPNVAQARFIDHIDRYGPSTSSLQAFNNDVYDYCALKGPNCSALMARRNKLERENNMRAEAANMARIWNNYGQGQSQQEFYAKSNARLECLRNVRRSIEAQNRGRQQWRYVNSC